jgi:hypothetical protein
MRRFKLLSASIFLWWFACNNNANAELPHGSSKNVGRTAAAFSSPPISSRHNKPNPRSSNLFFNSEQSFRNRGSILGCASGPTDQALMQDAEANALRQRYLLDKAKRESLLLSKGLRLTVSSDEKDQRPDYIERWGGADLAQEGPTRKVLELMSDSEW